MILPQLKDFLRWEIPGLPSPFLRLRIGNIPILAAGTLEIVAQVPRGKPVTGRIVVKEGFFLDGRDHDRGYPPVGQGAEVAAPIHPGLTVPPLALR